MWKPRYIIVIAEIILFWLSFKGWIMSSERILFVGNTSKLDRPYMDPSTRYRCFNIAYSLRERGHTTEVVTLSYFIDHLDVADNFDTIVFHRPSLNNEALLRFLFKNQDKKNLIADYDDLIFDVKSVIDIPNIESRDPYLNSISDFISRNAAANNFFRKFSVSTTPLSDRLKKVIPSAEVNVISNALSLEYIQLSRKLFALKKNKEYKIGYFPGTASHDNDFKQVAPYIAKFLSENNKEKMFILGPLKIPAVLNKFNHRIDHVKEVVPFSHLPYIKANVENIIAPLTNNQFNECKSGLKFFEAMPLGCRVIATPIPDIDRFESEYLYKCKSIEEWDELTNIPKISHENYEVELNNTLLKVGSDNIAKIWEEKFL